MYLCKILLITALRVNSPIHQLKVILKHDKKGRFLDNNPDLDWHNIEIWSSEMCVSSEIFQLFYSKLFKEWRFKIEYMHYFLVKIGWFRFLVNLVLKHKIEPSFTKSFQLETLDVKLFYKTLETKSVLGAICERSLISGSTTRKEA